jgi:hypothetical protein
VLIAVACSSLTAAKLELSGLLQGMLGRTEARPSHPCVHVNHHLLSPPLGSPLPVVCRVWFLALFPFLRWGRALKLTASLEENPFVPLAGELVSLVGRWAMGRSFDSWLTKSAIVG